MTQFKYQHTHPPSKRAAPCTPAGSMTVEAAFAIPIFLFASLCLVYILEIHAIQTTIRMAAHTAAKQTAEQMAVIPELGAGMFRSRLLSAAGADRLDRSIISGGSGGITCWKTTVNSAGQLEVYVEYRLKLPFPEILVSPISCKEEFRVKGWTGYEKAGISSEAGDGQVVYITDTASVYHEDPQCTYLQLSIRFVTSSELGAQRNEDGEKYDICEKCTAIPSMGGYYVTDYGDKYHSSLCCSGLKRTVYAVPVSEIEGKRGCSKCTHSFN